MKIKLSCLAALVLSAWVIPGCNKGNATKVELPPVQESIVDDTLDMGANASNRVENDDLNTTVRFATYNVSLNRKKEGQLLEELKSGESEQARKIAEVIQMIRPDVLLINEFDYDVEGEGIKVFRESYLGKSQNGQEPIDYQHVYFSTVNTGYSSGKDLNNDGKIRGPNDAFGFGQFPGKYAMVVLSSYPIEHENVRTFQKFLWKDMPRNLWPIDPETNEPYYSEGVKKIFRLSSKSLWDVPIVIGDKTVHFLTAHPTPPAFDGPEDRNGRRNHDEIRMVADYVGGKGDYLYDDNGVKGGMEFGSHFVIAGDMNADPVDGDGDGKAGRLLTQHPLVQIEPAPKSVGGAYFAKKQGQANLQQNGDPTHDTSDFNDAKVGNLRVDYCLPSRTLVLKDSGVFWPKPDQPGGELVEASDHRMVWIDVEK